MEPESEHDHESDRVTPTPGLTVSIRARRDVVIVDPERFLAEARRAAVGLRPELTAEQAAAEITDVYEAVHALLDRDGHLAGDLSGMRPDQPILDRPDGLSPAGQIEQIVVGEPTTLRDHGCFLPEDPFALPSRDNADNDADS